MKYEARELTWGVTDGRRGVSFNNSEFQAGPVCGSILGNTLSRFSLGSCGLFTTPRRLQSETWFQLQFHKMTRPTECHRFGSAPFPPPTPSKTTSSVSLPTGLFYRLLPHSVFTAGTAFCSAGVADEEVPAREKKKHLQNWLQRWGLLPGFNANYTIHPTWYMCMCIYLPSIIPMKMICSCLESRSDSTKPRPIFCDKSSNLK